MKNSRDGLVKLQITPPPSLTQSLLRFGHSYKTTQPNSGNADAVIGQLLGQVEVPRQEKCIGEAGSQEQNVMGHSPSIEEPTKTLRGALALGNAVQAAPSNPRGRAE